MSDYGQSIAGLPFTGGHQTASGVVKQVLPLEEGGSLMKGGLKLVFGASEEGAIRENSTLELQAEEVKEKLRDHLISLPGKEVIVSAENGKLSSLSFNRMELYQ